MSAGTDVSVEGLDQILRNLASAEEQLRRGCEAAVREIMAYLQAYAQTHHLWERDSGATDASTLGELERVTAEAVYGVLSVGTEYAVYLEKAFGGKYAWLRRAIEENVDVIRSMVLRTLRQSL